MNNQNAVILGWASDMPGIDIYFKHWDAVAPYTDQGADTVPLSLTLDDTTTQADILAAAIAAINDFATNQGFTFDRIFTMMDTDAEVAAKVAEILPQQSAIANAPADANTTLSGLLIGALTGELNASNTKQNDIASKLNAVIAALRAVGIIAT